jgi:enolase
MTVKIKQIIAREILDSRGWPTLEATVILDNGLSASASVPAGSSLRNLEAKELRDLDHKRYFGQGVLRAIVNIEEKIAPVLIGKSPLKQAEIDEIMKKIDGTTDKSLLGANAILAVSLAVARVAALTSKKSLHVYLNETFFDGVKMKIPAPIFTMFNGGCHADTNLDFQEYLLLINSRSSRFTNTKKPYAKMLQAGTEIYHSLGELLGAAGYDTDTGSEGGYAPDMDSSIQALELVMAASLKQGYEMGQETNLGIDIGSSALYDLESKQYIFSLDSNHFSSANLIGLYNDWLSRFPLTYLEDPVAPDDLTAWQEISQELGHKMIIAGDDFFATNTDNLRPALKDSLANAIVIIPAAVGTLTETIECLKLARRHNYQIVISHRSGETNDDFIADLAVASAADYFKGGAPARGERIAKWNRLLLLEDLLYGKQTSR